MDNFWTNHTIIFLIGLVLFPRFTLLFSGASNSILFWLGWFFLPRITVAVLATIFYSSTNPILVILSWVFAFGGESAEKKYGYKVTKNRREKKIYNVEYEIIEEDE